MSDRDDGVSYVLGTNPRQYQVEFSPLPMVESFRSLPRFSHSDDFSKLFSNDPEEVKDYSLGLLFLAIFIMSFFLVWTFIICLLKCIGPRYVGVLSGFPFKREGYKSRTGRVTLIFSCLSIIVLAVLVVVKGLAELQITSDTIALTSADVTAISTELGSIVDHLRNVTEWITPVRDSLVTVLQEDICPLQPGSESETDVRLIGNDTLVAMTRLDNFIANDLDDVEQVLVQLTRATTDVEQAVSDVQFNSAVVSAVMIPYYIIPAFLILAVVMGWNQIFSENYYNFVTWFIIPFLCLLTAFAIVVSGWVVLSIEANSDFCSPTPEDTISSILQQYNLQSEEMYYDVITFYTRQCDVNVATNPWIFLEAFFDQLDRAKTNMTTFTTMITDYTPEQLSLECGIEYSRIAQLLNSLLAQTSILMESSFRGMDLISCPNIVPLYTNAVYGASCETSIQAATWTFACALLVSFFGMVCIMFRGAYYPIDYFYYSGEDGSKSLYSTSESDDGYDDGNDDSDVDVSDAPPDAYFTEADTDATADGTVTRSVGVAMKNINKMMTDRPVKA